MMNSTNDNVTIDIPTIIKTIHDEIPTIQEYFSNPTGFTILSLVIGILMFVLNMIAYFFSIEQSLRRVEKKYLFNTLILLGLYPIVSFAAILAIIIPNFVQICHTIMHLTFAFGAIIFYKLCLLYVDGEDNYLKEADSDAMQIKTPPCCCCCWFLPSMAPTKIRLNFISCLIYQLPYIQFLIMITLNVIYIFEVRIYENCVLYFAPFMFTSILLGIWGLNIVVRMIGSHVNNHNLRQKFICLQLILILCKLQFIVLNGVFNHVNFGGVYPVTNKVYSQNIINLLILLQMFPLSIFAKSAYKMPTYL